MLCKMSPGPVSTHTHVSAAVPPKSATRSKTSGEAEAEANGAGQPRRAAGRSCVVEVVQPQARQWPAAVGNLERKEEGEGGHKEGEKERKERGNENVATVCVSLVPLSPFLLSLRVCVCVCVCMCVYAYVCVYLALSFLSSPPSLFPIQALSFTRKTPLPLLHRLSSPSQSSARSCNDLREPKVQAIRTKKGAG